MLTSSSRFFGREANRGTGLVFASLAGDQRLAGAAPGQVIRNEGSGPPWIAVGHSIGSVVAARWPGKLWEVEVLEAALEQPREGAGYTHARSPCGFSASFRSPSSSATTGRTSCG